MFGHLRGNGRLFFFPLLGRSAFASAFWIEALAALMPAEAEIVRI